MKSYKALLNEAARNSSVLKELSLEESASLKQCILGIYQEVATLCDNCGLTYMLAGGSCLGAVRHHGFIPWDDDLDMLMPRPDYEKLIEKLDGGALGEYYSHTCPRGRSDSPSMFLKVYRKDTVLMGLGGEVSPYPQNVFIDIFPLDGYSSSSIVRKIKGFLANTLRVCANMVYESRPMTDEQKEFYSSNKELNRLVRQRRLIGKILSIVPHRTWVNGFDSLVRNTDMTGLVGIPTGRKLYNGEVFPGSNYVETVKAEFEGIQVNIPSGWDIYLSNLYGSKYMDPPSEDLKERHLFKELIIKQ